MFDAKQFERGSDFRGDYPRQVNEELAFYVGRYLVRYLADEGSPRSRIIVGRDGRFSSFPIYTALIQGIAAEGGQALPCGLTSTDAVCWAAGARNDNADAGVMITASHNPPGYNGIKMVRPKKSKPLAGLDVIRPTHLQKYLMADGGKDAALVVTNAATPYSSAPSNVSREFVRHACKWASNRAEFGGVVVIDPGNGAAAMFLDELRAQVPGAKIEAIAATIDGRFPSRPSNPGLPGALVALQAKVRDLGAAFGAAFDGDADRLFMVDENGEIVTGDQLLAALIGTMLPQVTATEKPVAFAGTCSWSVVETIQDLGGTPILCKVGQDTLKVAMQNLNCVFGGEASAHFNFPESYYQDSGLIALMAYWQSLFATEQTVSQTIAGLPAWHHSGEINIRILSEDWSEIGKNVVSTIATLYREECYVLEIDGVSAYSPRVDGIADVDDLFPLAAGDDTGTKYRGVKPGYKPEWWFSLRRSNNEPLLRLNVECAAPKGVKKRTLQLLTEIANLCDELGKAATQVVDWGALPGLQKKLQKLAKKKSKKH